MSTKKLTFAVPGKIKRPGQRKYDEVTFFLEATDAKDARWQARHGVIDAEIRRTFPKGTKFNFFMKRIKQQ